MCGIAGFHHRKSVDQKAVCTRMLEALRHRGPDSDGMYIHEGNPGMFVGTEYYQWAIPQHHHSGMNGYKPAEMCYGNFEQVVKTKHEELYKRQTLKLERFVNHRLIVKMPPTEVFINPIGDEDTAEDVDGVCLLADTACSRLLVKCRLTAKLSVYMMLTCSASEIFLSTGHSDAQFF